MTPPATFADLALAPTLRPGLDALGYTSLTPIQSAALPAILAGRDLVAQAPTGSGKTAAFGLGLLQKIAIDAGIRFGPITVVWKREHASATLMDFIDCLVAQASARQRPAP